jgi:hypothetical protein
MFRVTACPIAARGYHNGGTSSASGTAASPWPPLAAGPGQASTGQPQAQESFPRLVTYKLELHTHARAVTHTHTCNSHAQSGGDVRPWAWVLREQQLGQEPSPS